MFKNISHVIPLKGKVVEQHTKENWIFCVKFFRIIRTVIQLLNKNKLFILTLTY